MLRSMTGYGRNESTVNGWHIVFEMRSVNHKFFECNARVSRGYLFLEDKLKSYLQSRVARGKIDFFLQIENLNETGVEVEINYALAAGYHNALTALQEHYQLPDGPSLAMLSRYQDVLTVRKPADDEELVWQAVLAATEPAVDSFLRMRDTEGRRLQADIAEKARNILAMVEEVDQLAPQAVAEYQERLRGKIQDLLGDSRFDEQRILTEVAVFADKVAIDEETVRLRSHFAQLEKLMASDKPVGRKIDFLVQEMNREANTIGSKSQNTEIAYLVVDIKSEIEKIREQVQNVE